MQIMQPINAEQPPVASRYKIEMYRNGTAEAECTAESRYVAAEMQEDNGNGNVGGNVEMR